VLSTRLYQLTSIRTPWEKEAKGLQDPTLSFFPRIAAREPKPYRFQCNLDAGKQIAQIRAEVEEMKKFAVGLLLITGIAMAQEPATQPQHLSENQRVALRTQSPPVKTHGKHSKKKSNYTVTENKSTIVATKPISK
jgi:hypothetical protein